MTYSILLVSVVILFCLGAAMFAFFIYKSRSGNEANSVEKQLLSMQEQLRESLSNIQTRMNEHLRSNVSQMEQTHKTVGERLDGVTRIVGDRLDNAARVVGDLGSRMMKVEEATKRVYEVGKDIAGLQQILRAPKIRGGLGEVFLTDLLAQMLPQDSYETQYMFTDGERVDAVIKTAHGMVPIDSKFPLEDFQRMVASETDEDKKINRKAFTESIKKRVNEAVKYIRPGEGTLDFVLMYIPAESIYYEIITRSESLGEEVSPASYAMKKKVIPVSPNTFYAYLNTILLGLKGMRVERFVSEIIEEMGRIKAEFGKFMDDFSKLGKHLSDAHSSYDKADKRLNRLDDRLSSLDHHNPKTEIKIETPEALPAKIE